METPHRLMSWRNTIRLPKEVEDGHPKCISSIALYRYRPLRGKGRRSNPLIRHPIGILYLSYKSNSTWRRKRLSLRQSCPRYSLWSPQSNLIRIWMWLLLRKMRPLPGSRCYLRVTYMMTIGGEVILTPQKMPPGPAWSPSAKNLGDCQKSISNLTLTRI